MDAESDTTERLHFHFSLSPILWPPDVKNQLIGTDPDAMKICRQKERMATEDDTVG